MPKVTIAIPTYNRSNFIAESITSAINQTFTDIEILIIDNNSSDNTKNVVKSFNDKRIRYIKNDINIGMMNNWNECIKKSRAKYLMILGDDDILLPNFIEESLKVFSKHKNLGFTFSHINKVDENGKTLTKWGYKFFSSGLILGINYLKTTIRNSCCMTNSSSALINKEVFNKVGYFECPIARNTFDLNMWIKITNEFDVFFINKILSNYRIHKNQITEVHWRRKDRQTGKVGTYLELIEAIGLIFKKQQSNNFLINKLKNINKELSELLKQLVPEL